MTLAERLGGLMLMGPAEWALFLRKRPVRGLLLVDIVLGVALAVFILPISGVPSLWHAAYSVTSLTVLLLLSASARLRQGALYVALPPAIVGLNISYVGWLVATELSHGPGSSLDMFALGYGAFFFMLNGAIFRRSLALKLDSLVVSGVITTAGLRYAKDRGFAQGDLALNLALLLVACLVTQALFRMVVEAAQRDLAEARERTSVARTAQAAHVGTLSADLAAEQLAGQRANEAMTTETVAAATAPVMSALRLAAAARDSLERDDPDLALARALLEEAVAEVQGAGDRLAALRTSVERKHGAADVCDLGDVVLRTIALLEPDLQSRGVDLAFVPDKAAPVVCRIRPDEIGQIVLNLVENAIRAIEGEPLPPVIRLSVQRVGAKWAELRVVDQGCGINREDLARLLAGDNSLSSARAGLGLSICRAIAEGHGGSIDLTSTPGLGTCAIVRLPLAQT